MAELVTVDDVLTYMDIEFSNRQEDAAQMVLDGLESELEAYLGRPVTQREFTETYVVPARHKTTLNAPEWQKSGMGTSFYPTVTSYLPDFVLYLNNSPVVSVSSLTIQGQSSTPTVTALTEGDDFYVRHYGVDIPTARANDVINIVYTAGLDGASIPQLKLTILRAASRELQNLHDDVVGLKDLTTRDVASNETGFLDSELLRLKRHRRVRPGFGLD